MDPVWKYPLRYYSLSEQENNWSREKSEIKSRKTLENAVQWSIDIYIMIIMEGKLVIASAFQEWSPHEPPGEPGDLSKEAIVKCPVRFLYQDDGHAFPETNRPV